MATFHAVSSVQSPFLFLLSFVHEAIVKCEHLLVLRHDQCQEDHHVNWSLRVLTCNVWTPIKFAQASLRRQVCGWVCTCGQAYMTLSSLHSPVDSYLCVYVRDATGSAYERRTQRCVLRTRSTWVWKCVCIYHLQPTLFNRKLLVYVCICMLIPLNDCNLQLHKLFFC